MLITGATVIDPGRGSPLSDHSILISEGRIRAVAPAATLAASTDGQTIDARGKFIIPGLMNANVHLLGDIRLENLARYLDRFEDLIVEAAQVALKNGMTTVFDTWGPRRYLMAARDRIASGDAIGSRIYCAGNIIGLDGPMGQDFIPKTMEVASTALVHRINSIWAENVGRHLMWLTPAQVAQEIRTYIDKGIDFLKYASNDHTPGAFLAFSKEVQVAIIEEAHRAGLTAQAHTLSVEGLRIAIEAGCDLIQHANSTGPVPIPPSTLELFARKKVWAVIFPWTSSGLEWVRQNVSDLEWTVWKASDVNARNLIQAGAPLLLANDGCIFAPEVMSDPLLAKSWAGAPEADSLLNLAQGHFTWFRAMEEKGCSPIDMLRAATQNIAMAYGKHDLGTIETGKTADLLVLDKNPLLAAENYRSIHRVIKDGKIVDRDALPAGPLLTRPMDAPAPEEACYVPFLHTGPRLPMHPMRRCCR